MQWPKPAKIALVMSAPRAKRLVLLVEIVPLFFSFSFFLWLRGSLSANHCDRFIVPTHSLTHFLCRDHFTILHLLDSQERASRSNGCSLCCVLSFRPRTVSANALSLAFYSFFRRLRRGGVGERIFCMVNKKQKKVVSCSEGEKKEKKEKKEGQIIQKVKRNGYFNRQYKRFIIQNVKRNGCFNRQYKRFEGKKERLF